MAHEKTWSAFYASASSSLLKHSLCLITTGAQALALSIENDLLEQQHHKDALLRVVVALEPTSYYGIHIANYLSSCEELQPFKTLVYCLKTHMAIAIGVNSCKQGYKVKFYTVTGLVLELLEARQNNTLEKLLKNLRSLDLLILDERSYVPINREASLLLYRVIDDSYENSSLVLTTNLKFSKWENIYTDS